MRAEQPHSEVDKQQLPYADAVDPGNRIAAGDVAARGHLDSLVNRLRINRLRIGTPDIQSVVKFGEHVAVDQPELQTMTIHDVGNGGRDAEFALDWPRCGQTVGRYNRRDRIKQETRGRQNPS